MTPSWDMWFFDAMLGAIAAALMAQGVFRLRVEHGKRWKAFSLCVLSVSLGFSALAGHYYASRVVDDLARTMKDPAPPSHLSPDWGASLGADKRSEISKVLASGSFVNWGMRVNYFDLDGTLLQYEPTAEDHSFRAARLKSIERTERTSLLLLWAAVGWVLVPWAGLILGFMPWYARVSSALTNRSSNGPAASGWPLS